MGNQQTTDTHDFGGANKVEKIEIQDKPHAPVDASAAKRSPEKAGTGAGSPHGKRDSVLGESADCEFQLGEGLWAQGKVKTIRESEDGSKIYEVENFSSQNTVRCSRSEIRMHDCSMDNFGNEQMEERVSLQKDGLKEVVNYQLDKIRKGYGFAGWNYTWQRLKTHSIPFIICTFTVIVWILLSHYDAFKYVDDGTSGGHGHGRRFLEAVHTTANVTAVEDPCHTTRRFLSGTQPANHDPIQSTDCPTVAHTVPLPKDAYLVGGVICCCIVFLLFEYPGWVVMIIGGTILTLSNTITEDSMWHAMAFPTVIACCSVTAVAKGLANTHVLRIVMEKIINFNRGDYFTLTMLLMITGLLSTVVDNFAVIGIFQYVYTVFGQKTKIDNKVLLISLSFISMIGGTCTVLASGAMLVAKSFLEDAPAKDFPHLESQTELGMFEMSIPAFVVLFFSAPFLAWWAPFLFGKKAEVSEEEETAGLVEHGHTEHGFIMKYQIGDKCSISHLHKLENASYLWKEVKAKGDQVGIIHIDKDKDVQAGDIVYILAPGNKIYDLSMHDYKLMELNPSRKNIVSLDGHVVAEGIVDPEAEFIGIPYSRLGEHIRHWHVLGKYHPAKHYPETDFLNEKVKGGDIILLEGQHHALFEEHNGFIHIAEHDSGHHHDIYLFQLMVSGLCLLFIIIATVMSWLSLLQTVIISLVILNQTGCLTIEEMLHKFKWRVLLLITGAYAMAHAFVDTKLAEFLTQKLMDITDSELGILIVMYVLSLILGFAFPPKAEIGILYPICLTLAQKNPDFSLKKLVIVVLQGTAIQLLTPNNPENSLIADGYTFKDFFLCGAPLAILSGVIFIPLLEVTYGI